MLFDQRLLAQRQRRLSPNHPLVCRVQEELRQRQSHFQRVFAKSVVISPGGFCSHGLAEGAADLIVSHFTLQTTNDIPGVLSQWAQALKPDGLLLTACLGGETLQELRQAFYESELELYEAITPRVMPMLKVQDLGMLLQRVGLALPVVDTERYQYTFSSIIDLMHFLRQGALTNVLFSRPKTLSRSLLAVLEQRYRKLFGGMTATFEVIYSTSWAPAATQQKPLRPGSAVLSLKEALETS